MSAVPTGPRILYRLPDRKASQRGQSFSFSLVIFSRVAVDERLRIRLLEMGGWPARWSCAGANDRAGRGVDRHIFTWCCTLGRPRSISGAPHALL